MTEAELCAMFTVWARQRGWTVYPEVKGIDLVLVRQDLPHWRETPFLDAVQFKPGDQVAVQAKLVAGCDVLAQLLRPRGPRWLVALVKRASGDFQYIARSLRIGVAAAETKRRRTWSTEWDFMSASPQGRSWPVPLPSIVPDLPAGVPSPRSLTAWRERALLFCARLRAGETFDAVQMKAAVGNHKLWVEKGWVVPRGEVRGPTGRPRTLYGAVRVDNLPDLGWEEIRDALVAAAGNVPGHGKDS